VRVVTATNRPLEEDIEAGRFREDLYYRLNVIAVHMPALRERMEDIPLLVDYFLDKYRLNASAPATAISQQAMTRLTEHQWPGNVRELENVIQRAVTLSGGRIITPDHLQLVPLSEGRQEGSRAPSRGKTLPESLAMLERQMITEALSFAQNNQQETAKLLGITPAYLTKKMQQYGISVPPTGSGGGN
jgi:DNA-binding NtrC family response regulator